MALLWLRLVTKVGNTPRHSSAAHLRLAEPAAVVRQGEVDSGPIGTMPVGLILR
jgi:hypothetical protein